MAATDTHTTLSTTWASPYRRGFAITPHDTNELTAVTRAIHVGGAGNIALTTVGGDSFTLTGLAAGDWVPVQAKIVKSTGTTATSLIGLY